MTENIVIAIVGGLLGTAVMTGMMLYGRSLNLPAIDAHGILGYMLNAERSGLIGYIMHFVLGVIFALGYVLVFRAVDTNVFIMGILLGILHWLVVGWMFALAPIAHAGMKAGTVEQTGAYMLKSLGFVGFIAGMIGHIVFGLVVSLAYLLIA